MSIDLSMPEFLGAPNLVTAFFAHLFPGLVVDFVGPSRHHRPVPFALSLAAQRFNVETSDSAIRPAAQWLASPAGSLSSQRGTAISIRQRAAHAPDRPQASRDH